MSFINKSALSVLERRYLAKDENGNLLEDVDGMFTRVAKCIARAENLYNIDDDGENTEEIWTGLFKSLMTDLDFLPNSPTLMNAGRPLGNLSACFVLPVEDSMEGIFTSIKNSALIHKCLDGDTWIITNNGYKQLKSLVVGVDKVLDRNGIFRTVLDLIPTGKKEVTKYITNKGLEVVCTDNHKFLCVTNCSEKYYQPKNKSRLEFKELSKFDFTRDSIALGNLQVLDGDIQKIKFDVTEPNCNMPKSLDTTLSWLLGYFIGNGSYHRDGLRFHVDSVKFPNLKEAIISSIIKVFGDIPKFKTEPSTCDEVCIYRKSVKSLFKFLVGENKHIVPSIVSLSPPLVRWSFISGLIDADGCVRVEGHLCVSTSYYTFKEHLICLFNSLGVTVGVTILHNEVYGESYQIHPLDSEDYEILNNNLILYNKFRSDRLTSNIGHKGLGYFRKHKFIRVVETEPMGMKDTYNLTVDSVHEYLVSSFVSKNSGGGTGFSFSQLRPKGSVVNSTGGVASGPVSFMKVFDSATEAVKQGGRRRGANMGILKVDHPDILEFIECKSDNSVINNFNISVGITENFMKSVESNMDYDLIDPKTQESVGSLNATEVFNKIVDMAWKNGEPGIIFLDRVNEHNPVISLGEIESTNPCVVGDTLILTDTGYKPIKDLVGQKVNIWNGYEWSEVEPKVTGEDQEILDIDFSDGTSLSCTPYHTFILKGGNRVKAKDLKMDDPLCKFDLPVLNIGEDTDLKEMYTKGFFCGDGSIETTRDRNSIWLYGDKKNLLSHLDYTNLNECDRDRLFLTLDFNTYTDKLYVPNTEVSIPSRLSWLAGILDSDGTLNDSGGSLAITSVNYEFLLKIKFMLVTLGVSSTINISKKAQTKLMPDGKGGLKEYDCKTSYRLVISASNVRKLMDLGLCTYRVPLVVSEDIVANHRYIKVESIIKRDYKEPKVYCFTEPKNHSGLFGCIVTGQCGEQPLLPYEACNLGSINLKNMLSKAGDEFIFDWDKLERTVKKSVRFLDNVIDVNNYPLPEVDSMTRGTRKIGLGVMGWADVLCLLGIPYNTEKAVTLAKDVMKAINTFGHEESCKLASIRGVFPYWKDSVYKEQDIEIRNATVTTIAPTGTLSMIAGVSGGIEPIFALAYIRNIMDNEEFAEVNPTFEYVAKQRGFYSQELMKKIAKVGHIQDFKEIPDDIRKVFVTSHDISPEWHTKMQAAFQDYTDNAVSKTVNLCNTATRDDVAEVYMNAYITGCKGVTIYRDGSRDMQVLNIGKVKGKDEPQEPINEIIAPREREDILEGITEKVKIGCGNLYVTVNGDNKGICEVFTNTGRAGGCPSQSEATSRLVSMSLRAGVDAESVVEQLKGIRCPSTTRKNGVKVLSCPDAIGRTIEKLVTKLRDNDTIDTDIKIKIEEESLDSVDDSKCPECGSKVEFASGCVSCKNCGWGKCG